MFPAPSPCDLALRLAFVGVVYKFNYDAILQEAQAVRNFASSLIEIFKDQISPICWEKKDRVQVLQCFLSEDEDAILLHRERSTELIRTVQEYVDRSSTAKDVKTTTIALLILSGVYSLFTWAEIVRRAQYRE